MKCCTLFLVLFFFIQKSHQTPHKGLFGSSLTLTDTSSHHGGGNVVPVVYPVSSHEQKHVSVNLGLSKYKPGQFIHGIGTKLLGHKFNKQHGNGGGFNVQSGHGGGSYGVNSQIPSYGHGYNFNTQGSSHGAGNGCNVCANDHNVNTNTGFGFGFDSQGGYKPAVNPNNHHGWSGVQPNYGSNTNTHGISSAGGFSTGGSYGNNFGTGHAIPDAHVHNQNPGGHVAGSYGGGSTHNAGPTHDNGFGSGGGINFNAHANTNSNAGDFITNTESLSSSGGYGSNSHDVKFPQNVHGGSNANTNSYSGSGSFASSGTNVNNVGDIKPVDSGIKGSADWSSLDNVGLNLHNIVNNNAQATANSQSGSTSVGNDLFKVTSGFSSSSASASSSSSNAGGSTANASASAGSQSSSRPSYG